ncbi:hypothetical protein D3C87_1820440 [compost metagenome]
MTILTTAIHFTYRTVPAMWRATKKRHAGVPVCRFQTDIFDLVTLAVDGTIRTIGQAHERIRVCLFPLAERLLQSPKESFGVLCS